jgi:RNA polymerase sigma factor (sigma-70 family)
VLAYSKAHSIRLNMAQLAQNSAGQKISPELVRQAQRGNKECLDQLAERVREQLYGYIYRLTLDYDLTQDLLQETILCMLQSLNQLEYPEQLWHWLYRTALGKIQHHNRELKSKRGLERSEEEQMRIHHQATADFNDGLTELLRKELSDAVFRAMKRLKLKYRNILLLRCFENLEYEEIAEVLNISELQSRVLFFRAKTSLRKQLASDGLGSRYFLLALALFGLATASSKTVTTATITAATLEVGMFPTLLASLSSKIGLAMIIETIAIGLALPFQMFLMAVGVATLVGLGIFAVCALGNYLFGGDNG